MKQAFVNELYLSFDVWEADTFFFQSQHHQGNINDLPPVSAGKQDDQDGMYVIFQPIQKKNPYVTVNMFEFLRNVFRSWTLEIVYRELIERFLM